MENIYLLLIWNNALFCKDRIIRDLKETLVIKNSFYVAWNPDNYEKNLKALYGRKATNINEKISAIGTGKFLVVIVEDSNPVYIDKKTTSGVERINKHLYEKKWMYRKWTGGEFRIHGSLNFDETRHDLCVLFGSDFDCCLNNGDVLVKDTKSVAGFGSITELVNDLNCIENNAFMFKDNKLLVLCKCRLDFKFFCGLNNKTYDQFKIGDKVYDSYFFGEEDGDIPVGFVDFCNSHKSCINDFFEVCENMSSVLDDNESVDNNVKNVFEKYSFPYVIKKNDVLRKDVHYSVMKRLKNTFKYYLARIKYTIGDKYDV